MNPASLLPLEPPPVAFMVWQQDPAYGRIFEDTTAGDLFVLAHLGFFFLLLGCFGWAAWSIWRRTCRPQPHMRLIMEIEEAATAGRMPQPEPVRPPREKKAESPPWERPEDWWKRA